MTGTATERVIWKYTIPVNQLTASSTTVQSIPAGARLLHCREQHGALRLWYEIPDPDAPKQPHRFQIFVTGHGPIRDGLTYVGTGLFADGALVLHLYEVHDELP